MKAPEELLVRCASKAALEAAVEPLGGLVGDHPGPDGTWLVRAFPPSKLDFLAFAIERQGYGELVDRRAI